MLYCKIILRFISFICFCKSYRCPDPEPPQLTAHNPRKKIIALNGQSLHDSLKSGCQNANNMFKPGIIRVSL